VNNIIGPALIGKDPTQQTAIDNFMVHELDGTQNEWGWCKQKVLKRENSFFVYSLKNRRQV